MSRSKIARITSESAIWADKYTPTKISEVVGNREAVSKIAKWLEVWREGKIPDKRAILLVGPTGTGKTSMVYAIANELGYEVVEINASDKRDRETLMRVVSPSALLGSLFSDEKGRLILFDEVDGLSGGEDRGGVSAIVHTVKETLNPIILTANDRWETKIRPLHSICVTIELRKVVVSSTVNSLGRICQSEHIKPDPEALRLIAENSNGDLRSAINDLQAIAEGRTEVRVDDVKNLPARRDRVKGIFDALRAMFQAESCGKAKSSIESLDMDHDMLIQWIYENIPREFASPPELAQAFDSISRADVFLGRIKKSQEWGLLSYVYDLMSAGVALARKTSPRRFVNYSFPNYIRSMSSTRSKRGALREVSAKIAVKCHASTREVMHEDLPSIKTIIENSPKMGIEFVRRFGLTEDDIEAITGGKKIELPKKEKVQATEKPKPKAKEKTAREPKQSRLL